MCTLALASGTPLLAQHGPAANPDILTPAAPATPRINAPSVYGARPGAPFLYAIPATGVRPMTFAVEGLPAGLKLDTSTGHITGSVTTAGEYKVILRANNSQGSHSKAFRIVIGDKIALTPPMGWNSWNCWAGAVDQDKVLRSAKALVDSGLANYGWSYVNIDDTWQGKRGGPSNALQPNEKFPDMKGMVDKIHSMGLKAGIYHSPWVTTYAYFPGGSTDTADGAWSKEVHGGEQGKRIGKYSFVKVDAKQFADWGFDYLKYDWNPNDVPATREMSEALRATGRDIVFSLSNSAPLENVEEFKKLANCWRTTGDIWDQWETPGPWQHSVSEIGFNQDAWTTHGGPGHWNDPDMLVVGHVGWGPSLHPSYLTPAQQYTHISLWALLASPLLIGCDLERMDDFTKSLLSNNEVIAINQDALGQQARRIATVGAVDVFTRPLEDGSIAFGFFNRGDVTHTINFKLDWKGAPGWQLLRDVWRQKDLGVFQGTIQVTVESHNVKLYKATAVKVEEPKR